jgi:hypothetical protein
MYADPTMLKVPSLPPPTKVAVSKIAPNPVALPSKFYVGQNAARRSGVLVMVIIFIENSPLVCQP